MAEAIEKKVMDSFIIWGSCLLLPRLGGIGCHSISSDSNGENQCTDKSLKIFWKGIYERSEGLMPFHVLSLIYYYMNDRQTLTKQM
ncbi:5551_t:CDS:2 [Acaulospora morrowiae]|uniref:5551_t:CDS:1 n=1 Tax=Acaulospora morrowiae TaxID=94023 RepID=A0A9N9ABA3_9GLOM|nr:5551_t:CDS:2 [Acaulospora morrowiae]